MLNSVEKNTFAFGAPPQMTVKLKIQSEAFNRKQNGWWKRFFLICSFCKSHVRVHLVWFRGLKIVLVWSFWGSNLRWFAHIRCLKKIQSFEMVKIRIFWVNIVNRSEFNAITWQWHFCLILSKWRNVMWLKKTNRMPGMNNNWKLCVHGNVEEEWKQQMECKKFKFYGDDIYM